MKRDAIDLGTINVFTLFKKYFIPTLMGMLSMSAVTAVDGIYVGHGIGSDGIAAINICIPLLMLFTGVGLMMGVGSSVVASIQLSKGKTKAARIHVTQALLSVTLIALVPSTLMYIWPSDTARLLGASPSLTPLVREYLLWFIPSLLFQMWCSICLFVIRLDGNPRLAMQCNVAAALISVILGWLFIFPLKWGLMGAALAAACRQHHRDCLPIWLRHQIAPLPTEVEHEKPAPLATKHQLPMPHRLFRIVDRSNTGHADVHGQSCVYEILRRRRRRCLRHRLLLHTFCIHGWQCHSPIGPAYYQL